MRWKVLFWRLPRGYETKFECLMMSKNGSMVPLEIWRSFVPFGYVFLHEIRGRKMNRIFCTKSPIILKRKSLLAAKVPTPKEIFD